MFRPLRSIALLAFVLLAGLAQAQQRPFGDKPAPNPENAPQTPPPTDPDDRPGAVRRDPTKPNVDMRKALNVGKTPNGTPAAATAPAHKLLAVSLRARVIGPNQPPIAFVEIDKQVYSISADARLVVGGHTLQVLEISANQIRLKLEPENEIIVLR